MKELHRIDGAISSDTYLGTKMNRKALDFHTQLYEWNESQKLTSMSTKHFQLLTNAKNKDLHMPFQKIAHIDCWAKQVNRYYLPSTGGRPKSGSFMKIDVTKYNMKVDKNDKQRSKSALYRPVSAASRFNTGGKKRFFGTDVHTVNNNLIECQMHYSAQRKDLHSAKSRRSISKVNNPEQALSDNKDTEEPKNEPSVEASSDKKESSDSIELESYNASHNEVDFMQPQIVARSWSNRMLNVISIDDCKLTCRYRPQVIKENHTVPEDYEEMDRARANKVKRSMKEPANKETKAEDVNGQAADDGQGSNEDVFTNGEVEIDTGKVKGNSSPVYDSIVDTNNNTDPNTCHELPVGECTSNGPSKTGDISQHMNGDTNNTVIQNKTSSLDNHTIENRGTQGARFSSSAESQDKDTDKQSSQYDSKTSYGHITTLYSNTETVKSETKEKKKVSRTSRINYAIENMVKERKVMNSLERDFESRTAPYGRTIVEKSEGSEMFKKRHANLRKKIDNLVNTHSAKKTNEFYERRSRCSSASSSRINSCR